MSSNNPSITASDIVTDVESRFPSAVNISTAIYLPWISYSYQRTYQALVSVGQEARENLFGAKAELTLVNGTAEYALSTYIPRYGSFIKGEILYGASGDQWVNLSHIRSVAQWRIMNNVSTSYRAKDEALVYFLADTIGFIPTPPASDSSSAQAKIWYVKRPYQINSATDVVDIPYRFIYPVVNYVQAKAIEKKYQDFSTGRDIERRFKEELEEVAEAASQEFDENTGAAIEVSPNSQLYNDPFSR